MNRYIKCALIMILFAFAVSLMPAQAATNTWNTTTGDWSVAGNWSGGLPGAGDDIVITNAGAYVYLTNSTPALSSLTISNAVLSFSNANATLNVTNLSILNGGSQICWGAVSCGECLLKGGALALNATTSGPTFDCSGNLTLTNAGKFYVSAGLSVAGAGAGYGGLVNVTGNVSVAAGSWIYPAAHPTNGAAVLFNMHDLTLSSGGGINANYLGYIGSRTGGTESEPAGALGPGSAAHLWSGSFSGSGYGGAGGRHSSGTPGSIYGSLYNPIAPGSGSYTFSGGGIPLCSVGADGGGSVQIRANGTITIAGTITANGQAGLWYSGGGASGGGIYITCGTFIGNSNGVLQALGGNGMNHSPAPQFDTGGGGGGRIAVWRDVDNSPSAIQTYVNGGAGGSTPVDEPGANGTVVWAWTSSTKMWNTTSGDWSVSGNWLGGVPVAGDDVAICAGGTVYLTNSTPWLSSLIVDNGKLSFSNANGTLCASNLTIQNNGTATCWGAVSCSNCLLDNGTLVLNAATSGPIFNCSADLTLTNAGRLYVTAGLSVAGAGADYGGLINVGGDIRVATNSWIYPAAHPTNGAAVLFNMRNLTLSSGGGINADYLGYIGSRFDGTAVQGWYGPGMFIGGDGAGSSYGSGYGGAGGRGVREYGPTGGPAYGSSNAPVAPGSGSYAWSGGAPQCGNGEDGGGSVQIRASKTVAIQGTITANGQAGHLYYGAGASGGGIYIRCYTFTGNSNGVLQANGGNGEAYAPYGTGGGGGGRIAVWRVIDNSPSAIATYVNGGAAGGGVAQAGTNGTVVWGWAPRPNTLIRFY